MSSSRVRQRIASTLSNVPQPIEGPWTTTELRSRLSRAADLAGSAGIDALLVSPGADLRYLTGYHATALERLTALVLPANTSPTLVVPNLEVAAATASPAGDLDIEIVGWAETADPYALVASLLGDPDRVAVDDRMWAVKAFALQAAMPNVRQSVAGSVLRELRMRKSAPEIAALARAGAAIDAVHAAVSDWLKPGRTENEVGRDIADAIGVGHETVDFIIVASGPNGASPHHSCSDRVLQVGDVVVVDIGGTTADGYCSDSTRTYTIGEPAADFARDYQVLLTAQQAATAAVRPGVLCEELDAVARGILSDHGLGELFIHRLGHGIGLETHEDPYLVAGNRLPIAAGMAFSIEPGFYLPGFWGARIEDIVVCSEGGVVVCNDRPRELVIC